MRWGRWWVAWQPPSGPQWRPALMLLRCQWSPPEVLPQVPSPLLTITAHLSAADPLIQQAGATHTASLHFANHQAILWADGQQAAHS